MRHVTVDALVFNQKEQILLIKRNMKLSEGGKWALPGGYADRDETLIEGAAREIMEETGWKVKNIELLRIVDSPNRPKEDRQNIAFFYTAEAVEKTGEPDWESDDVKWFDLSYLPTETEMAFDHLENIRFYLEQSK